MKIWITRQSTGSIHSGGLERLEVWFTKPIYVFAHLALDQKALNEEVPWGETGREGLGRIGWIDNPHASHKDYTGSISFGKLFKYGDEPKPDVKGLANFVWDKLNEHYGNTEFVSGWYEYEKQGKCKREDFLLEIDLKITSFKLI